SDFLYFAAEDDTIAVIDAGQTMAEVHKDILALLQIQDW
ncbi:hypothetical protein KT99_09353, partial [Shewanella benthica KT99]